MADTLATVFFPPSTASSDEEEAEYEYEPEEEPPGGARETVVFDWEFD